MFWVTIKITRFLNIVCIPFLKDFGTVNHWLKSSPKALKTWKTFDAFGQRFTFCQFIFRWRVDDANKYLDGFDKNRQRMHTQPQVTQAILRIISMVESASRKYDAKPVYWLASRAWKMCSSCLSRFMWDLSSKKTISFWPWNKSFIEPACSVKMAGYWPPRSFLRCYYRLFRSVNAQTRTWSISSLLDLTLGQKHINYQEPVHVY